MSYWTEGPGIDDVPCPTCGPTRLENHPHRPIFRCFNCKTWLMEPSGQLFFPIFHNVGRQK